MCMLGMGTHATCVLIDLRTALADCQIVVPSVTFFISFGIQLNQRNSVGGQGASEFVMLWTRE